MKIMIKKIFKKRRFKFLSLRYKIIIFCICCFIIPLSIVTAITFNITSETVKNKANTVNYNLLSQIGDNLNYVLDNVHGLSLYLLIDKNLTEILKSNKTDDIESIKTINSIQESLLNWINTNKNISYIGIVGNNGVGIEVGNFYLGRYYKDFKNQDISNMFSSSKWQMNGQLGYFIDSESQDITFIRNIRDKNNLLQNLGLTLINVPENSLYKIYSDKFSEDSKTYIIDQNGTIISSSERSKLGQAFDSSLINRMKKNKDSRYLDIGSKGKKSFLYYYKLDNVNWYVINEIPVSSVLTDTALIGRVIFITTILFGFIYILFTVFYMKRVLKPLIEMSRSMKEIEKENYSVNIIADTNDEVGILARSFNRMVRKLDELIKLVYSFEIKQRDVQIEMLRSQINPHFLYNTLDCIFWKSRMENAPVTSEMIKALSMFFRKSIGNIREKARVSDEMEHIRNYIYIQSQRFESRIEFSMNVDETLMKYSTINFVLQPLVENSLHHGIERNGGVGTIEINIFKSADKLVMEVTDDGYGVDLEEIDRLMKNPEAENRGLAIKNINDRIQLLYGEKYGLFYKNNEEGGTTATVVQPLIPDETSGTGE